ncbi:zinc ribbon-containing protein [Candidatus Vondammii sp. HM_W22]|uniref:zinc ribbon-containing protein n=1 Tax=Candidatus Vondammii sp. HM_W22 TaxID=2687299 RepID=UPI001F1294C7|nr:zinc ribbon-containing protein [Candidatus Vondammii sp. HM_W22]
MKETNSVDRLVNAYERMLEHVDSMLDKAEKNTLPNIKKSIDAAREKAVELNELTREEAEKVAAYLERDMKDAAHFLSETGDEFRAWFKFDVQLVEARVLEMLANVADRTRLELDRLAERAREGVLYHTGEITGPGTLVCTQCGKELHFHKTGHIPPCPKCHATEYRRR